MATKIVKIENLASICAKLRKKHSRIITTNGVFDLLHVGHMRYLQKARALGDILIVGINSDKSVKQLKGEKRPINNEKERAEVLCALECVDFVCIFNDKTPINFILAAKPSIHVKGGDYDPTLLPETKVVEKIGGKVKIIPFEEGYSTSSTIKKILELHDA